MHSELEKKVLTRIRPLNQEREDILKMADELKDAVDKSGIARGMIVGSVARETWVSGDRDLDVFMLFETSFSKEELEEKGLGLAREIATAFDGEIVEKYAEHPYINANINGFDVDLVPCYAVLNASEIKSAVDRTPFHTRYIKNRINGFTDDVLLLKQFSKACGVYGSDQMTEGFAGYLCEIFILYYGGFSKFIEAASEWHPEIIIDLENHQAKDFNDPLVVIDPVDPRRNVAASLSATRMYEFSEFARGYLSNPSDDFFIKKEALKISQKEFSERIKLRGTSFYGIIFDTPGLIPDIIVPQLRKSVVSVTGLLERNGFTVNRADSFMGERKCILLFELLTETLPDIEKRAGPLVWDKKNSDKFISKHLGNTYSGPYISENRYYIEINRKYPSAFKLLQSDELKESGLGKHVKQSVCSNISIMKNTECWNEEFSSFLQDFIEKRSPISDLLLKKMQK
ncbi:MAG: CCA tRNA nucleotidyltransferase [Methanomicrobiaceae archaeon]|nr:CCA tRNA nucleotidyltransferase [Methanomicrobiaceae archaeon]